MAHAIHLSSKEWKLLKESGTTVAHCPTSNASLSERGLGSGLFDYKKATKMGIPWALGSDIGGGPWLSMFDVMRSFILQNKEDSLKLSKIVLYRSTLAAAKILNLDKNCGNLNVEKDADFIVLKSSIGHGMNRIEKCPEKRLKSIILCCEESRNSYDKMVSSVFLKGIKVKK
jgi:guanine deaminase